MNDMTINVIDEEVCCFQEYCIEKLDNENSACTEKLEYCNKKLGKKVTSLEAINEKCYQSMKYLNSKVTRLEKDKVIKHAGDE